MTNTELTARALTLFIESIDNVAKRSDYPTRYLQYKQDMLTACLTAQRRDDHAAREEAQTIMHSVIRMLNTEGYDDATRTAQALHALAYLLPA